MKSEVVAHGTSLLPPLQLIWMADDLPRGYPLARHSLILGTLALGLCPFNLGPLVLGYVRFQLSMKLWDA